MFSETAEGRFALITGGAKRIGAALAQDLHQRGASVCVHYRASGEEAERLCAGMNAERPGSAAAICCDLISPEETEALTENAAALMGRMPDMLICNASFFAPAEGQGAEAAARRDALFRVNASAPLQLAESFAARRRAAGDVSRADIIFITDYVTATAPEAFTAYAASRAAAQYAVTSLARRFAPEGIRVNAIAPGYVIPAPSQRQTHFDALCASTPLKGAVPVADITAAVCFLLGASSVTGQTLYLDNGARLTGAAYAGG